MTLKKKDDLAKFTTLTCLKTVYKKKLLF